MEKDLDSWRVILISHVHGWRLHIAKMSVLPKLVNAVPVKIPGGILIQIDSKIHTEVERI